MEQYPDTILDFSHRVRGKKATPGASEPVTRDGAHLITHREAYLPQASLGRIHADMKRHVPVRPCEGDRNGQARRAVVEDIGGDDDNGSVASLLVPLGWIQVNEPYLTT